MNSLGDNINKLKKYIDLHPNIEDISEVEITSVYQELIDGVVDLNHSYYIQNNPIISDKEYDELFDYLKKIEEYFPHLISSNSPTQGLISQISEGFKQVPHKTKLLSLENTYNAKDLVDRDQRIKKIIQKSGLKDDIIKYSVEPKFDGLSVELVYKNGKLIQAITRGDGFVGEDITDNVKTIKNIPRKIKVDGVEDSELHVRGEILMPKSVREKINKEREILGENIFANTRNAAAGSIKLLDSNEVSKRKLDCFVYDVLFCNVKGVGINDLSKMGLPVFKRKKENLNIEEVVNVCEDETTKYYFQNQDYDFDGIVIKTNDSYIGSQTLRDIIGATEHHPRRAVAYKFPAQQVATQVLSIDFQIGRTGIITPVANLQAVKLSGATISRTTLHNFDFVSKKDIRVGDYVWLQRSGEVIPYIVGVIKDKRNGTEKPVIAPSKCTICGSKVDNIDIHYYCSNSKCPNQIKAQVEHFVSKQCMDIDGIGESIIELLVDQKIISDFSDLYKLMDLNYQILLGRFPGFGTKKISEINNQLQQSRYKPLWRLLNAIGISHVGKKTAVMINESLISNYSLKDDSLTDLDNLIKNLTDKEFVSNIFGIGEKTVEAIYLYFNDKNNLSMLTKLEEFGLNFDPIKYYKDKENIGIFEGLNEGCFSITGSFPFPRDVIIQTMQKNGWMFHENPNKGTNIILVGDKPGNKKEKAKELKILIYEGWQNILNKFSFLENIEDEKPDCKKIQNQSLF